MLEYGNKKKNKTGNKDNFGSVIKLLLHTDTKSLAMGLLSITSKGNCVREQNVRSIIIHVSVRVNMVAQIPLFIIDRKDFPVIAAIIKPAGSLA